MRHFAQKTLISLGLIIALIPSAMTGAPGTPKARATAAKNIFSGTWCVGGEGLVINFRGADSISVSSRLKDKELAGSGTYTRQDSLLTATITNEDLTIVMGYRYKVRNDSAIRAKIIFMTVDGDSIDHPARWLRMRRCDPATFDFSDTTDTDD